LAVDHRQAAPQPNELSSEAVTGKRWMPFILALLALFASAGLNVYLGWIAWDAYNRYQDLLVEMQPAPSKR
jgi:hypothetical protein